MPPTKTIDNPFQLQRDETQLAFRRPSSFRLLSVLLTLLMIPMTLLLAWVLLEERSDRVLFAVFLPCVLLMATVTLFLLYLSGPNEIRFDLRQRTYRYRRGLPLLPHVSEGKIEEFDYFYVLILERRAYETDTIESRIYLVWKVAPKVLGFVPQPELLIGLLPDRIRSYELAREYGGLLGLREEKQRLKGKKTLRK